MHLICFPYAGGSAAIYRGLHALLASIKVHAVELPGRGRRLGEPAYTSMEALVAHLLRELAPYFTEPFALLGHSMGGAVAFELACQLPPQAKANLHHLFLSASRAPGCPRCGDDIHDVDDEHFIRELRRLGGTPTEVLDNQELMSMLLPMLKADFTVVETYTASPKSMVNVDITALAGDHDKRVTLDSVKAWAQFTQGRFDLRMIEGDHFFLKPQLAQVAEVIRTQLTS